MEILLHKNSGELLDYLPHVKSSVGEWLFVDIRMTDSSDKNFTAASTADSIYSLFKDKDGKIYVCNDLEILVVLRWRGDGPVSEIAGNVERQFPEGRCEVHVREATIRGLTTLETLATYKKAAGASSMADIRGTRRQNVVLIADDDVFMRILVKNGLALQATVREVGDGNEIIAAYKQYAPDVLFLDIHMPNREGTSVLGDILTIDPKAYVIMLSADNSPENIETATQKGAKDFLVKPFTKEKLMEYVNKCPTIS